MFVLFSLLFFLSQLLEDTFNYEGTIKGLLLAIPLLALCISSFTFGKIIKSEISRMKKVIYFGLLILGICTFFIGFIKEHLVLLFILLSIIGLALGSLLPALDAMITENIKKEFRGTITSFYSSARFIGVAAGPPIMALINSKDTTIAFMIGGILCLACFLLVISLFKTQKKQLTSG